MSRHIIFGVCCFVVMTGSAVGQDKTNAQMVAEALKGGSQASAENNKVCKLFTRSEASSYIGAQIQVVDNAAAGTGCQWRIGANEGSMLVQVVPARYHETPSRSPGYKKLPEVGREAFVTPEMGGWHAGSLQGAQAVHVTLSGKGASEAKTIDLLREAMKRQAAAPAK
jgi:hypothetical protein